MIRQAVLDGLGIHIDVGSAEYESWRNSLGRAMFHVVNDPSIPDDAGIAIEYRIHGRRQRIDLVVAGRSREDRETLVVIELKQWSSVESSPLVDHVRTFVGGRVRDVIHPSFQAWSYAQQLTDFYEVVRNDAIAVEPCAYAHNCADRPILIEVGGDILKRAPLFQSGEHLKLRTFIASRVASGPGVPLIKRVDRSAISPGKQLTDALSSMLDGNPEFVLVDEQKTSLENILYLERETPVGQKAVVIVRGGPGTGKSLIAVNALVRLSAMGKNARYVTKNAAPRKVYEAKLRGQRRIKDIREMFVSSDAFRDVTEEAYDVLLVDEAHRLTLQGGLYGNLGENQIEEVIRSSRVSVFFIDESQAVTWKDYGTVEEIERVAGLRGVRPYLLDLASQFRCAGANEYVDWVRAAVGLGPAPRLPYVPREYDVRVVDDPVHLRELIRERNRPNNRSRIVAGYCWEWISRRESQLDDIVIDGTGFRMKWNLVSYGSEWLIAPNSVDEAGCIHTVQGLECDYVGVIIGPDLCIREGVLATNPFARARSDKSLAGLRKAMSVDEDAALARADRLIRNTYMTLLTRGMRGCYIYCVDSEVRDNFSRMLSSPI